jgi:hypothetical protein
MNKKVVSAALLLLNCIAVGQGEPNQTGPTVSLVCNKSNPLNEFMYFVPLISPVEVTNQRSENNRQIGYALSYQRNIGTESFSVSCEFRMQGQGYNMNDFDKQGMIARNEKAVKNGKPIKNILDYIKFNGEGTGRIDVYGTISQGVRTVNRVEVHFNAGQDESPVYAGLYSVKCVDGKYLYENRYGIKVARVNTLVFTNASDTPRMEIRVDSVASDEASMGFMGSIIGAIANMIIQPLEIAKVGNDEMLRLGLALSESKETFTFPKAQNLIVK